MLRVREVTRILAYRPPVDMRNSFDGLVALVKRLLNEDPLSGTLYVFTNRRRNRATFCPPYSMPGIRSVLVS